MPLRTTYLLGRLIPLAGLTLLGGPCDVGKSTMLSALAASVTTGRPLLESDLLRPHDVIWYTMEEQIAEQIAPRLIAHDADLGRVVYPQHDPAGRVLRRLLLPTDLHTLQEHILQTRAALAILDPISSFLGPGTSAMDAADVRSIVEGVMEVAAATGCAIVATLHDRKGTAGPSIQHFAGSAAWTQTPRVVLRIGYHPHLAGVRVLCPDRFSLGRPPRRACAGSS